MPSCFAHLRLVPSYSAPAIFRKLPGNQFLISCTCTFWIWPWTSTLEFACPYLNMQVYMCNRPVACPARTLPLGLCQQGQAPATLQIWIVWVDENGWNHGLPYWPESGSQTSKRKSNLKLAVLILWMWSTEHRKWATSRKKSKNRGRSGMWGAQWDIYPGTVSQI